MADPFTAEVRITAKDLTGPALAGVGARLNRIAGDLRGVAQVTGFSRLASSLRGVGTALGDVGRAAAPVLGALTRITGVSLAASLAGMAASLRASAKSLDEMAKASRQIGLPLQQMREFQYLTEQQGISWETANAGLVTAAKNYADLQAGIGRLGDKLGRISPQLAAQIRGARDSAEAFDLMMESVHAAVAAGNRPLAMQLSQMLFGTVDFVRLGELSGQQFREGLARGRRLLGVLGPGAGASIEAFNDSVADLKTALKGLSDTVAVNLLPRFTETIGRMGDWVAVNREWLAGRIGEGIDAVAEAIRAIDWKAVGEGLRDFAGWAGRAAEAVGGWRNVMIGVAALPFANIAASLINLGIAVGSATGAIGGVVVKLGWFAANLAGIGAAANVAGAAALWTTITGIAAAAAPFAAAAAALAAAGLLIYKYWQPLKAVTIGVAAGLSRELGPVLAPIGRMLAWIADAARVVAEWFVSLLTPVELAADEFERLRSVGETVGSALAVVFNPFGVALEKIGDALRLMRAELDNLRNFDLPTWFGLVNPGGWLGGKIGGAIGERLQKRAAGGPAAPGWALVGEEGPELVRFGRAGHVYTAGQTRAMLSPERDGGREVARGIAFAMMEPARTIARPMDALGATMADLNRTMEDMTELMRGGGSAGGSGGGRVSPAALIGAIRGGDIAVPGGGLNAASGARNPLASPASAAGDLSTAAGMKNYLMQAHGMSAVAASAVVGHLIQESGLRPGAVGDGGAAYGLAQWHRDRLAGLRSFAAARGGDAGSARTQLDYIAHELATSERRAGAALTEARTLEEATAAFMHFERPAGYSPGRPEGGHAYAARLANARRVMAMETAAAAAAGNVPAGTGGALKFGSRYRSGADPRLADILDTAAKRFPGFDVTAISGYRPGDPRFHGRGMATDVSLRDLATGRTLANYQDAATFRTYEQFAQVARRVQMEKYPELARAFRWGGYFSGGRGTYGAVDPMHFDLGGERVGMAGGSWEHGLTARQRALWPGIQSTGMAALVDRRPADVPARNDDRPAMRGGGDIAQAIRDGLAGHRFDMGRGEVKISIADDGRVANVRAQSGGNMSVKAGVDRTGDRVFRPQPQAKAGGGRIGPV